VRSERLSKREVVVGMSEAVSSLKPLHDEIAASLRSSRRHGMHGVHP